MMSAPLISVIVAFYNVASYAAYCVESLLKQSFDDYEIILVNDGSTDNTKEVLLRYSSNDKVKVLSKANGGLSDARNYGVQHSSGALITFVDGDDVVSPHYLSSLYAAMTTCDAQMVIGHYIPISFEKKVVGGDLRWGDEFTNIALDKREAVERLLYDDIQPSACAKLASRRIYEECEFPVGVRYEEIRTVLSFFGLVDSFAEVVEPIYGYVMREGSITWSSTASVSQLNEYLGAINTICSKAYGAYPELIDAIRYQRALLLTRAHSQLPHEALRRDEIKKIDAEIIRQLRGLLPNILSNKKVSILSKVRMATLSRAECLYDLLYRFFRNKIKNVG